jgi:hypothetical protein
MISILAPHVVRRDVVRGDPPAQADTAVGYEVQCNTWMGIRAITPSSLNAILMKSSPMVALASKYIIYEVIYTK